MSGFKGFWRSTPGAAVLVLGLALLTLLTATAVGVHRTVSPPRRTAEAFDFDSMKLRVEDVEFEATDGMRLRGVRLPGPVGSDPIVLCHDLGESAESLLELGTVLRDAGFDVLMFDFRGHGGSAGGRSTLGLDEKRDVVGAVDTALALTGAKRVGIFGVGMGAYAGTLAARDRPAIRVLVLDGVYPDAGFRAVRGAYDGWGFAAARMDFLARGIFALSRGSLGGDEPASEVVASLTGRDLLLLAPAGDTEIAVAMQRMYEGIPDQVDADGNLVMLPATHGHRLAGEQLERYHERVLAFFTSRLGR